MNKKYRFFSDGSHGSHGWLEVGKSALYSLGILDRVTQYSYQNAGNAYLEEDTDVPTFLIAMFGRYTTKPEREAYMKWCRAWWQENVQEMPERDYKVRSFEKYSPII